MSRARHAQIVWVDVTENIKLRDASGVWSLSMHDLCKALQQLIDPHHYDIQLPESRRVSSSSRVDIMLLAPGLNRSRLDISDNWKGRIYSWKDFLDRNKLRTSDVLERIKKNGERENRNRHRSSQRRSRRGGGDASRASSGSGSNSKSKSKSGSTSSSGSSSSSSSMRGASDSATNQQSMSNTRSMSAGSQTASSPQNGRHNRSHRRHRSSNHRDLRNGRRHRDERSHSSGKRHTTTRSKDRTRTTSRSILSPYAIKVTNHTPFRVHLTLCELIGNRDQSSSSGSVMDRLALYPSRDRKGQDQGFLRREPHYQTLTQTQCIIATFRALDSRNRTGRVVPLPMVLNFYSQSKEMDLVIQETRIINYSIQPPLVQQNGHQTLQQQQGGTTLQAAAQQQPTIHQPNGWN